MSVYPTITNRHVNICLQIPQGKTAALRIYDISGRVVKDITFAPSSGFATTLVWDGCDNAGRSVPAGVYFVSFEAEDCQKVEKTILLK
jgi:flagellar hook assembly protein FlgD